VSALAFLLARSFKNALLKRVRRLRDTRYLISMLVFFGYLTMVCGGGLIATLVSDEKPAPASSPEEHLSVLGLAFALGLMLLSFASTWIWPERNQLIFSPAEIQFLFPAPLARTTLVRLKIVKAQLPLAFTALIAAWASRHASGTHWWAVLLGTWLAFNASFLHRLAAALTLVPEGSRVRDRAPLVLGRIVVALVFVSLVLGFRRFDPLESLDATAVALAAWAERVPTRWVLLPFRLLLRPAVAPDLEGFVTALPGALAVLGILYVWVIRADAAFEEASIAASQKFFTRIERFRRTGKLSAATSAVDAPIRLSWQGSALGALVWKNLVLHSRAPLWRRALFGGALALAVAAFARWGEEPMDSLVGERGGSAAVVVPMLIMFTAMSALMGPELFRFDLRTSLGSPDLLKALPLRGRTILLGEIAAPVLVVLVGQAYLLLLAAILASGFEDVASLPRLTLPCLWAGAVIALAPFDLLLFLVANGAAIAFPAWVPLGPDVHKAGAEAGGMRMLVAFVRMIVLGVGFFPAAIGGGVVAAAAGLLLGAWLPALAPVAIPLGALAGAIVLAVEAGALAYFLGRMLDRFDPSFELK
jgi:hypothetical protein